jgi:hypothetical protein
MGVENSTLSIIIKSELMVAQALLAMCFMNRLEAYSAIYKS